MGGRDWEHLDVPHLGFASCPTGRRERTVPAVFSAADPVVRAETSLRRIERVEERSRGNGNDT